MNLSVYACDERARARLADLAKEKESGVRSKRSLVVESVLISCISCTDAPKRFTMPRLTKEHAGGEKRQDGDTKERGGREKEKKKETINRCYV